MPLAEGLEGAGERRYQYHSGKWLRPRANIFDIDRPRLLSVSEAATELNASDAYVRRLLLMNRLYGIKVGPVWAIFPSDLEAFKRGRRPPGRPRKVEKSALDRASAARTARERIRAGTDRLLRKRLRQPGEPHRTGAPAQ